MDVLWSSTALIAGFLGLSQPSVPLNWQAPALIVLGLSDEEQPALTISGATGGAASVMCPGFINPDRPDFDVRVTAGSSPNLQAQRADSGSPAVASLVVYDARGAWHCLHAYDGQVYEMLPEQPDGVLNVWIGFAEAVQTANVTIGASDWSDRFRNDLSDDDNSLLDEKSRLKQLYANNEWPKFTYDASYQFSTPWGVTAIVIDAAGGVSGSYEYSGGRLVGVLGPDGLIEGRWSQMPSFQGQDTGEMHFTLGEDGCSLQGLWRYDGESAWRTDWTGTRIGGGC